MRTFARSGTTVAAVLLVLALVLGACSGGGDDPGTAEPDHQASSTTADEGPPPLETRARFGTVTGTLSKSGRRKLETSVVKVVDGWLDAAFIKGDYPRNDFRAAFPRFTRGARTDAYHDRKLMSNQDIGRRIDGATATRRRLWIDALVVRRHPVGVTARFALAFTTVGALERKVAVRGRLFLTRDNGWRVFGYQVNKSDTRRHTKGGTR